jgi:hypothetical protein
MTHVMEALDVGQGDVKTIWDSDNEAEVAAARKQFDDLRGRGFAAFRVTKKGEKGERITTFDPDAESLILVPPIRGG